MVAENKLKPEIRDFKGKDFRKSSFRQKDVGETLQFLKGTILKVKRQAIPIPRNIGRNRKKKITKLNS